MLAIVKFLTLLVQTGDQETSLLLVWSAKSVLFEMAVKVIAWVLVKVINTFCEHRTNYFKRFVPDLLNLPKNKLFDYKRFLTMTLDDPIWNDGFLCTSCKPWALDSRLMELNCNAYCHGECIIINNLCIASVNVKNKVSLSNL
ncbi:uncharacterized protein VP01_3107g1 [Puccinia sorghi]|uniref:Uncharacterized protein n=1 Tax=Puccinia sorghi TaxID=27349 RepID=A0A0L6UZK0_9BASI|nr:uncharacterized protein VP01_3107g1 [Puccinia sorghi]